MPHEALHSPRQYKGVMVSSTFDDLKHHRAELMEALRRQQRFAIRMEEYVPDPEDDVISSSLKMVRKASAYIGLISHRYGQVIENAEFNPQSYSVSRLEFEEAQRLGLPTLVFIMGEDHPVRKSEIEVDQEKIKKLEFYRERAKEGRIYVVFNSLEDFIKQAIHAVASLRRYLEEQAAAKWAGAQHPIQFNSCFISYSTKDEEFARRLHSRMQQKHLRVWFAPEDMKGGKKIVDQIEIAIQKYDKLLLVLSESSIQSEWVCTEIRKALEAERKESRRKLFPIRLIDFDTIKAWKLIDADTGNDLAVEIRSYFMPDFSHWKDDKSFESAFKRLLRDLEAEERLQAGR